MYQKLKLSAECYLNMTLKYLKYRWKCQSCEISFQNSPLKKIKKDKFFVSIQFSYWFLKSSFRMEQNDVLKLILNVKKQTENLKANSSKQQYFELQDSRKFKDNELKQHIFDSDGYLSQHNKIQSEFSEQYFFNKDKRKEQFYCISRSLENQKTFNMTDSLSHKMGKINKKKPEYFFTPKIDNKFTLRDKKIKDLEDQNKQLKLAIEQYRSVIKEMKNLLIHQKKKINEETENKNIIRKLKREIDIIRVENRVLEKNSRQLVKGRMELIHKIRKWAQQYLTYNQNNYDLILENKWLKEMLQISQSFNQPNQIQEQKKQEQACEQLDIKFKEQKTMSQLFKEQFEEFRKQRINELEQVKKPQSSFNFRFFVPIENKNENVDLVEDEALKNNQIPFLNNFK